VDGTQRICGIRCFLANDAVCWCYRASYISIMFINVALNLKSKFCFAYITIKSVIEIMPTIIVACNLVDAFV